MLKGIFSTTGGGRSSLPFSIARKPAGSRLAVWLALTACLCLAGGTDAGAQQPKPRFPRPRPIGKNQRPHPIVLPNSEAEASNLLKLMLHPQANFAGEETTEILQSGRASHQIIKGDTTGRVIRKYISPDFLKDDIMLTGPNLYAYYTSKEKKLYRPAGGRQEDQREQKMLAGLNAGRFSAQVTNRQVMIAGRSATQVTVFAGRFPNLAGKARATFWIDPETGIKLQTEITDANGQLISRSTMQSIKIGNEVVSAADFEPPVFERARLNEVKRENFASLAEAESKLPFRPVEPQPPPVGFRLERVTIATPPNARRSNVILHYTNGVIGFTLQQHLLPAKAPLEPVLPMPNVQRWRIPINSGVIVIIYRGHLTPEQMQELRAGLHVSN